MALNDKEKFDPRCLQLTGYLGLESLPEQAVSNIMRKAFTFNLLCIGETGIGKTTLMNSLFRTTFDSTPRSHDSKSVSLNVNTYDLLEGNVNLKLTIVETVGFGDQIDKKDNYNVIVDYVDEQLENYLLEEKKLKRDLFSFPDTRIHACLYFVRPNIYGLRLTDLLCMKALHEKVNIIPIIAKADSMDLEDRITLKSLILTELNDYGINIYKFPADKDVMDALLPFAVVGSTDFVNVDDKMIRAREYSWGVIEVDNDLHSDLIKLRELLICTHMDDLCQRTHNYHYELFRQEYLLVEKKLKETITEIYTMYEKENNELSKNYRQLVDEIQEFIKIKETFKANLVNSKATLKRKKSIK